MPKERSLTAPTCPCGQQLRRRRVWFKWAQGFCSHCGRYYQLIDATRMGFIHGPKPKANG